MLGIVRNVTKVVSQLTRMKGQVSTDLMNQVKQADKRR